MILIFKYLKFGTRVLFLKLLSILLDFKFFSYLLSNYNMEWGVKENWIAMMALHNVGTEPSVIFHQI